MSFPTKILLGVLGIFLLVPFIINAQTTPEASLDITLNPSTPSANSTVDATVNSIDYAKNIDTYNIVWTLNGKKIAEGIGFKEVSFQTGAVGTSISLNVTATNEKVVLTGEMNFSIGAVALIWESNSYVPPFYKGKKLSAQGATFKVTAITEVASKGKNISPNNLIYNWYQNDKMIAEKSGYGKNVFSNYDDTYVLGGNTIKVNVLSIGGGLAMSGSTYIPHSPVNIMFYENDPALGLMYNRELRQKKFVQTTSKIDAEPYYFSANKYSNRLSYVWTTNGEVTNNVVSVTPEMASSQNGLSLTIKHLDKMFQKVSSTLKLSGDYSADSVMQEILSI
jgi:hypothetical protein